MCYDNISLSDEFFTDICKEMMLFFVFVSLLYLTSASPCSSYSIFLQFANSTNSTDVQQDYQIRDENPEVTDCNVTEHSSRSRCCECGNDEYVCNSLDDALNTISAFKPNLVYISVGRHSVITLKETHEINDFDIFVLQGFGNVTIQCNSRVSLQISDSCNTYIDNVMLLNCGGQLLIDTNVDTGALILVNNRHLEMNEVTIAKSQGTGLIIITKFDSHNHHEIHKCDDKMSSPPEYTITNCTFSYNSGTKYGGGIYMSRLFAITTINNTVFEFNSASSGGGAIYLEELRTCHSFRVLNSVFYNNSANNYGGAIHFSGTNGIFEGVRFINNTSLYTGGAVHLFITSSNSDDDDCSFSQTFLFNRCNWSGNSAKGSSGLNAQAQNSNDAPDSRQIVLQDCMIENNSISQLFFFGQTACTFYVRDIYLNMSDAHFLNNEGTAVCAQSSTVTFEATNEFIHNQGYLGGALYLDNTILVLKLQETTNVTFNLTFSSNIAVYGGSIYQSFLPSQAESEPCLFVFENKHSSANYTLVHFLDNTASSNGNSIYFLDPSPNCANELSDERVEIFPKEGQISSEAFNVTFLSPVVMDENGQYTLDVILGQNLIFNVTILDYFNRPSFAEVRLFLVQNQQFFTKLNLYELQGFKQFSLGSGINYPNIFITGTEINETDESYVLEIFGLHTKNYINLIIKECPLGFTYNANSQRCICVDYGGIKCDYKSARACIKQSYWLGKVNSVSAAIASCTTGYCQNVNGNCTECPIISGTSDSEYCLLPSTENEQCIGNRKGVLCAECKDGYAFTFGSIECVPDSSCSDGQGVVPPLLNIFFIIIIFIFIILILKLDYKLSSGYVFCFVYYFSIISYIIPSTAGLTLLTIISIFESVTQLNPQFLGYVPICFAKELTPLQQQVFLYVNPLIISVLVVGAVLLSRCCKRFTFKDNTLIKAICLLLLLSFTSLSESSFNIFNGVSFEGITGKSYVYIQPYTEYFDTGKHLPWFILALLVMFFLVIPFTLLLLVAPLLSRCFNLNKIKPFLDEFQGCYKDNFRWMAGYYFVCRLVYFSILTIPGPHFVVFEYFLQLISFFILVVHMLIQPYQNQWLNFTDSLLLADIALVTFLYGDTANTVFQLMNIMSLREILTYTLVFIPILYLVVIISVTAGKHCVSSDKFKLAKKKSNSGLREPLVPSSEVSIDNQPRSLSVSIGYRDPALALIESNGSYNEAIVDKVTRRPVSYSIIEKPTWQEEEHRIRTDTNSSQAWQNDNMPILNESKEEL